MPPPITEDQERLSVLGAMHVLDPHTGLSLDRITALAAHTFAAPVAFVSVLDTDRQRFISKVGLAIKETDMRVSICAHAITCDEAMVIPDLKADPRFRDNPLVVGPPFLRFYAGAPLRTENGIALGALCIMDHQPRELTSADRVHLATLAALTMEQLELRTLSGRREPVSHLPNRHQFRIDYEGLALRHPGAHVYAVMVDVFDVPRSDEAGQALGMPPLEALIRRAGVRMKLTLDGLADVYHVGVARFAFIVDLPGAAQVEDLVRELRQRMSRPLMAAAVPMSPRFSAGLCAVELGRDRADDALRKVLIGLHAAFEALDAYAWYSEHRDARMQRGYRLAADAERGLRKQEFYLDYQPRYRSSDLAVVSAEALIRWIHPRLGPVGPSEFIPVFERTAIMQSITPWVMDTALDQLATWRVGGQRVALSLNLSGSDLGNSDLCHLLLGKLAERALPPSCLEVEITEGEWLRADSVAGDQVKAMAAAGIQVAIDDFGSGYSNFSYLSDLPITTIKLDKSLIDHLGSDPKAKSKVRAIVNLAHELGYQVVAEGVETQAQLAFLRRISCDQVQGYLLSRPVGPEAVLHTLAGGGHAAATP